MEEDSLINHKPYMAKEYLEHEVFQVLKDFKEYYSSLSFRAFGFLSQGVERVFNIDSYILSSIEGTLDSVSLILSKGRMNDAFALVRKYNDAIIMDIYKSQFIRDNHSLQNWIVKDINDWAKGEGKLPWYETMIKKIRENDTLSPLNTFFDFDGHYMQIRRKCNNNNHYNSLAHVMLNDNSIINERRIKELDQMSICLKDLFIMHFAYTAIINPQYISSSDYIDCLDCGMTPEEGSQYWVAPYVQQIFDKYVVARRLKLANHIKANCGMQLD